VNEILTAFQAMDEDNSGSVDLEELIEFLSKVRKGLLGKGDDKTDAAPTWQH